MILKQFQRYKAQNFFEENSRNAPKHMSIIESFRSGKKLHGDDIIFQ